MRKYAFKLTFLLCLAAPLTGCPEKSPMEKAGDSVDEAVDETGDALDEAGDDIDDAVN